MTHVPLPERVRLEEEEGQIAGALKQASWALTEKRAGRSGNDPLVALPTDVLLRLVTDKALELLEARRKPANLARAEAEPPPSSSAGEAHAVAAAAAAPAGPKKQRTLAGFLLLRGDPAIGTLKPLGDEKMVAFAAPGTCTCEGCGKIFKTPEGLVGHKPHCEAAKALVRQRAAAAPRHAASSPGPPSSAPAPTSSSRTAESSDDDASSASASVDSCAM